MVEMKEQLEVTDLKGNKIGVMNVRPLLLTEGCYGSNCFISLVAEDETVHEKPYKSPSSYFCAQTKE